MSLFKDSMRPPTILSDEAVERYLAALREAVDPDPLFRRRLRGRVVNRFVAMREQLDLDHPRAPRRMGALGRACLYASFALGVSVTGVMAASQEAVPGDLLYPLKLEVEQMRLEVLPESLHDQLAAYSLGERIEEMGRLSERGNWTAVTELAETIDREYHELLAADAASTDTALHQHVVVLNNLLERLPEPARIAVQDLLEGAPGISQPNQPNGGTNSGGSNNGGSNHGGTNNGGANSGGTNSGGTNSGGSNNGDTNNGGTNSGGTNSGGTNSGGSNNGGTNNGGTNSGGSKDAAEDDAQPTSSPATKGSTDGSDGNSASYSGAPRSGNQGQPQPTPAAPEPSATP